MSCTFCIMPEHPFSLRSCDHVAALVFVILIANDELSNDYSIAVVIP
eukprot:COSAG02_NODE_533_length_20665_cov_216.617281_12_plen_47_part_00